MKLKKIILVSILLLSILSGCQTQQNDNAEKEPPMVDTPQSGGSITFGIDTNNLIVDPLGNERLSNPIYQLDSIIYRGLAKYNNQLQLTPDLAEFTINQEAKTISIKLKDNLKFSDGTTVTAEDVLFTYNFYSHKDYQGKWKYYTFNIQGAAEYRRGITTEVVGIIYSPEEKNITINYDTMDAEDILILAAPILSKKQLEGKTVAEVNKIGADGQLLATGPYQLKSVTSNELTLDRNQHYEGNSYLDQIQFVNKQEGQVYDLALELPHQVNKDAEDREVIAISGNGYQYLGFNLNNSNLKDINIRKAIASAIDEQKVIDSIYQGYATKPGTPIHQDSWAYSEVSQSEMTQEEIKAALNGKNLSFNIAYEDLPIYKDMATEIANQLTVVGVTVNLNPIPQGEYISRLFYKGEFDLFIASWGYEYDPIYENKKWLSKNDVLNGGYNVIHVNDKKSDDLLTSAKAEIDYNKRTAIYADWQNYFMNQYYYLPLASPKLILSKSDNLTIDISNSMVPYNNIENWWVKPTNSTTSN